MEPLPKAGLHYFILQENVVWNSEVRVTTKYKLQIK